MFHILLLNVFPGDCLTCGNELKQFIAKRNYLETLYTSKKYPPTTWHLKVSGAVDCATGGSEMQQASPEAEVGPSLSSSSAHLMLPLPDHLGFWLGQTKPLIPFSLSASQILHISCLSSCWTYVLAALQLSIHTWLTNKVGLLISRHSDKIKPSLISPLLDPKNLSEEWKVGNSGKVEEFH